MKVSIAPSLVWMSSVCSIIGASPVDSLAPPPIRAAMERAFNRIFAAVLVASRWVMAPLCLGLSAALLIVIVQFGRELAHAVTGFAGMRDTEVILVVLKLVDLVL